VQFGKLPLHYAAENQAGQKILEMLLLAYPLAANTADHVHFKTMWRCVFVVYVCFAYIYIHFLFYIHGNIYEISYVHICTHAHVCIDEYRQVYHIFNPRRFMLLLPLVCARICVFGVYVFMYA